MVSLYYYKSAFEPLHVQLSPLDSMVTVVNRRLEPKKDLEVNVRVYDFDMNLRWQKRAKTNIGANTYHDVFAVPDIPDLTPVYFAKLELKDGDGKLLSSNFYWLSVKKPVDYTELSKLPPVKVNTSHEVEKNGEESIVHVTVKNPTDKLAFFIHLVVTKGPRGEEVLPVFWEDNYFSLLPGESRKISATFATENLDGTTPCVEVGSWNIQSEFECTSLKVSLEVVPSNEPFTVTATVENTFADGSLIELYVDDKLVDSKLVRAREEGSRETSFTLSVSQAGLHKIRVGGQTTPILVK